MEDFFENANIFITGGTGFIGKVLIEKLLRSQNNINKLYILLRSKKEKNEQDRIKEDIFDQPVFDKLKEINPNFMDKVVVVCGDILQPQLGISEKDKLTLFDKINIIYNCAASLNMNGKLAYNVKYNVLSIIELLALCRQMKNLKSLVVVSTAYSHCTSEIIEERICESPINPQLVIEMCNKMDEKLLDTITPNLLSGHPNTYTFSKLLMENILQSYTDLPIVLFRPSIVQPAVKEPVLGWIDNYNGPIGLLLACGIGIGRVFRMRTNNSPNLVPVDMCSHALICSAWHGTRNRSNNHVPVYNYSCEDAKWTWKQWADLLCRHDMRLNNAIWRPIIFLIEDKYIYSVLRVLLHTIPNFFIDLYLAATGNKLRLKKILDTKIYPFAEVLKFFCMKEWQIKDDNIKIMWEDLTQSDKEKYSFDSSTLTLNDIVNSTCIGIKVFIVKEKMEENYRALRKQTILYFVDQFLVALLVIGFSWIFYKICGFLL